MVYHICSTPRSIWDQKQFKRKKSLTFLAIWTFFPSNFFPRPTISWYCEALHCLILTNIVKLQFLATFYLLLSDTCYLNMSIWYWLSEACYYLQKNCFLSLLLRMIHSCYIFDASILLLMEITLACSFQGIVRINFSQWIALLLSSNIYTYNYWWLILLFICNIYS